MMPGDGAVWPAIVRLFQRTIMSSVMRMMPDTSNTQTRGPLKSLAQALSEPGPLALRLVTLITVPLRPAAVSMPNPAAPGITGSACALVAPSVRTAAPRRNL
jgi:hypothetical protein